MFSQKLILRKRIKWWKPAKIMSYQIKRNQEFKRKVG